MGGGSNSSSSTSTPLTPEQRTAGYQAALSNIAGSLPGVFSPVTTQTNTGQSANPTYSTPGDYRTALANGIQLGDATTGAGQTPGAPATATGYTLNTPAYNSPTFQQLDNGSLQNLQQQMTTGYEAPLDYAKAKDSSKLNDSLAERGIWSSGLAQQAQTDLDAAYAPQYAQAGANATNAATGLQAQQLGQENTFNLANAQAQNQNAWTPLNYLQGIWNGTGGTVSSGSGGGWNFSI